MPILLISRNHSKVINYLKKIKSEGLQLFEIKPEEKEYSIKQIKNLVKETSIFNKEIRVYLLENFHLSSIEAQNSFLKLLEEPPNKVLFVLTTDNEEKLISTIRSRTKIIHLEKTDQMQFDQTTKEFINSLISSKTIKLTNKPINLDDVIIIFRERLNKDKNAPIIIKEALRLKTLLEKNNLNKQLAIDHMLIFIKKQYTIN